MEEDIEKIKLDAKRWNELEAYVDKTFINGGSEMDDIGAYVCWLFGYDV